MTPEQRIDAAIDSILRASGSALKYYTMPSTLEAMRAAMHKIMVAEYISGSNDCHDAVKSDLDYLRIQAQRYATARCMNPQQWKAAWELNMSAGKPFDEIIDDAKVFKNTKDMPLSYVYTVPDHCDRIVWRNQYLHLNNVGKS